MILIIILLVCLLAQTFVIAHAARWMGSTRSSYGIALLATVRAIVASLYIAGITLQLLPAAASPGLPRSPLQKISIAAMATIFQAIVLVAIFAWQFRLTVIRALVPFAMSLALGALIILFCRLVIKPLVVEAFDTSSASMSPTIVSGDRVIANKLLKAKRWDIICYHSPPQPGRPRQVYCHRLIGLQNDRLRFSGGQLFVNEQLTNAPAGLAGKLHASIPHWPAPRYLDDKIIQLGADEIFVVGDNLDLSGDSRLNGPSHSKDLIGVVDYRYWPISRVSFLRS